VITQLFAHWLW